jgi:hypothetical protein
MTLNRYKATQIALRNMQNARSSVQSTKQPHHQMQAAALYKSSETVSNPAIVYHEREIAIISGISLPRAIKHTIL